MKKVFYSTLLLLTFSLTVQSQNFNRKEFNYSQLKKEFTPCENAILIELEKSINYIQKNKSEKAVESSKQVFDSNSNCYEVYDIYALSLFRNGKLMEGIKIIDEAIEKFGSIPDLIKRRIDMSIELYQVGINQRNVDGNSVFLSGDNQLPYDEEQFKSENLKSALLDLEYLTSEFPDRYEDIFMLAKIQQLQGNFEKSTGNFEKLISFEEFRDNSLFNIAENFIQTKKYSEAEKRLLALSGMYPYEFSLLNKLEELYKEMGDTEKEKEYRKKGLYYEIGIHSTDFLYDEKNYETLVFFSSEKNSNSKKLSRLSEVKNKESENYLINVCLSILKMHANHGNGLEEKATEILEKIGRPSLEKTHQLLQTRISTCTMTNLAQIMSVVKDESSWELLVGFLGHITSMPSTLIPPNIPEKIIQFDENRGTKEVLKVIKELLKNEDSNILSFGNYIFYSPLKKMNKNKVINYAKEVGFTEEELKKLKVKMDD